MKNIAGPPALQFFKGLSEVVENLLVDELEFAFHCRGNYLSVDGVKNQAKPLLTLAKLFFGALTFFDVEVNPDPVEDRSVVRSKGLRAAEEPAVVAFSVTNPKTHVARAARPQTF